MKASALKYAILSVSATLITAIFVLIPFHAFLTVWLSTAIGHYTLLRLWKEALLLLVGFGVLYLMIADHKIRTHTLSRRLVWIIVAYGLLQIVGGWAALAEGHVTKKALGYALISNLRFLLFFLVAWAIALRTNRIQLNWAKVALVPALIIVPFGLVQEFVLAPRFLEHFGYSQYTILPFQYVDNQSSFLRVQSTLRGANPFGAYLLLIAVIGIALLLTSKNRRQKLRLLGFEIASLGALFFTYSRSAWIGTVAAVAIVVAQVERRYIKKYAAILTVVGAVLIVGTAILIQHNRYVQNTLLHTSNVSRSPISSNEARANSIEHGLKDIAHEPLGRGPGTAGPASVYNKPHPSRISEDYYIQIGQETGWAGLTLFILINAGVGYLLWTRRRNTLALALFASLVGLTIVNLLSHAWADDTLAYVWWGLAGIAMATMPERQEADVESS